MKTIGRLQSVFVSALVFAASVCFVTPIGAQDTSSSASLAAQRGELAESILAAKERALGEPFDASIRASLKGRMETLSMDQLQALAEQGESANLPLVLGSVTSDLVYTPVTPCRVFDSRVSQGGPGPIAANGQWNVVVSGTVGFPPQGGFAGGCGVPLGATSVIINFVTVTPAGPGNIRAWAVASPQPAPPLAAVMNYGVVSGLPAIANGLAVSLCNPAATSCALGDLRLQADVSATDILGDVVGYFGPAVGDFVDLTTAQTVAGSKTFSSPIAGSVTGSAAGVTGIVPIANGGTGSATQNFVDLTTAQTVGGDKTLTGNLALGASTATTGNILKGASRFIHNFGTGNTFIGEDAGNFTMAGGGNTASGAQALFSNNTGGSNTATGRNAMLFNTTGGLNTATGVQAMQNNTTGGSNTASGVNALFANTTAGKNVASGVNAMRTQSFDNGGTAWDSFNTAVGYQALFANQPTSTSNGVGNTAIGAQSLQNNTTGTLNTAGGAFALLQNMNGGSNTASGSSALQNNTDGGSNTASGVNALLSNTAGSVNTASGVNALFSNTTGGGNTASGYTALLSNTTGFDNTASGRQALQANTTGSSNTASGRSALSSNTTGSNNTAIGFQANVSTGALTNATAIGANAIVSTSDTIQLGNAAIVSLRAQVGLTVVSDRTKKENFRGVDAQEVLQKLRDIGVTSWNYIGHDPKEFRHYGPMAQDFFAAFGRDEVGAIGTDTTINSGDITGILMIGLKGLDAQMQKDQQTISAQATLLKQQTARIADLEHQTAEVKLQTAEMAALKQQVASMASLLKTLSQPSVTQASLAATPQE